MIFGAQRLLDALAAHKTELAQHIAHIGFLNGQLRELQEQNTRLRSDLDWFKLNFNMVQRERAQLIYAAIGVKTSIPEFVPQQHNPEDALNQLPDLSSIGGDAKEQDEAEGRPRFDDHTVSPDYSMMPGHQKQV